MYCGWCSLPVTKGYISWRWEFIGARDLQDGSGVDGRYEPLPLAGISIPDFGSDVIGNDERAEVACKEIHPVDAEEVEQNRRIDYDDGAPGHASRAAWAKRSSVSPSMSSILPSSRTRPREISSRRYASIAR